MSSSPPRNDPPQKSSMAAFAPALLVCATALLLLWVTPDMVRSFSHSTTVHQVREASLRLNTPSAPPTSGSFLDHLNQASRDVASFVRPSVVHITSAQDIGPHRGMGISTGSGWIWDADGHILTNSHVVSQADQIDVQLHDGTVLQARIVGLDELTDIAVIRIQGERLVPATRADAREELHQGSLVFAFGSPMDFRFSMSQGIISGLGRSVGLLWSRGMLGFENFIQVDAAINPGNSGGPLTNHRGEVIGMNTAIAVADLDEDSEFSGIGLAIPMDMIESVATQLIQGGVVRKGFLGVNVVDQNSYVYDWLRRMGLQRNSGGILVSRVQQNGVLAEAGLNPRDVITHYDDQVITSPEAFWKAVEDDQDNESNLSVWRPDPGQDNEPENAFITISCEGLQKDSRSRTGLLTFTEKLAGYYRAVGFDQKGILIASTTPGKPAYKGGLKAGDIITRINGRRMESLQQLRSTISSLLPDSVVEIDFWRPDGTVEAGSQQQLSIVLDERPPM
ncbi:MAG: trypsin-like peptidase domain-containing protein [Phycisphaerales bacterium]|nr:trypsin-like peptidase domain-containing protein [Phycisphaerales bacterium]